MLTRAPCAIAAGALGLLLNTKVRVEAHPQARRLDGGRIRYAAHAVSAVALAKLASLSVTATDAGGLLPFASASLSSDGQLVLGWKFGIALLLLPAWLVMAPSLLPMLCFLWLMLPAGPTAGSLSFDMLLRSSDLNRKRTGWRWLLGGVLSGIAQSSLPAMLASLSLNGGGGGGGAVEIPPSQCRSAAVAAGRLVLDGRVQFATADGPVSMDYTLRMAVQPQRRNVPGVLRADGRPLLRSALLWDRPEIRLSLGETGLARLLPKLWVRPRLQAAPASASRARSRARSARGCARARAALTVTRARSLLLCALLLLAAQVPVNSASGIELPACVDLQVARASDAADGLVFSGVIDMQPPLLDELPAATAGTTTTGSDAAGRGDRWTDEERAALRLPPSKD